MLLIYRQHIKRCLQEQRRHVMTYSWVLETLVHVSQLCPSGCPQIQGAILVSSLLQIVLGFSGLVGLVLKYIGPLAIAPTINLIGLSLFIEAGKKSGGHWGIAAL